MNTTAKHGIPTCGMNALVTIGAALWILTGSAVAFPGETMQGMIARYGPPFSLSESMQIQPAMNAAEGKTRSLRVVWPRTTYRLPFLPVEFDGKLVATLQLGGSQGLKRIGCEGGSAAWTDLQIEFETFYTTLSQKQFEQFVGLAENEWSITRTTLFHFPLYEMYQAVSHDRRMKAEFAFLPPLFPLSPAEDPIPTGQYPDGNVWIRLELITGEIAR